MEAGVTPSPILGCPFFDISIFALDWLHIMDLGVACDFMGNFFKLLLKHKPGHTQALRCQALFRDVVDYYERMGVESRLDNLTYKCWERMGGLLNCEQKQQRPEVLSVSAENKQNCFPRRTLSRGLQSRLQCTWMLAIFACMILHIAMRS
jgi:hypothetical protein